MPPRHLRRRRLWTAIVLTLSCVVAACSSPDVAPPTTDSAASSADATNDAAPPAATPVSSAPAGATPEQWLAGIERQKGSAGVGDVIRGGADADTAKAIESFYALIVSIGGSDQVRDAPRAPVTVAVRGGDIQLASSVTEALVEVDPGRVRVGRAVFTSRETIEFFTLLARLLAEAEGRFEARGVHIAQAQESGAVRTTRLEFAYGPTVIVLATRTDGATYFLDAVGAARSALWNRRSGQLGGP